MIQRRSEVMLQANRPCSAGCPVCERRKQESRWPFPSPSLGFCRQGQRYANSTVQSTAQRHLAAAPNQCDGLLAWPNAERGALVRQGFCSATDRGLAFKRI